METNAIQRVFAALLPHRAEEPLTDWKKGVLMVENFSLKNVDEKTMLEALIMLLLTTSPSSPDSFTDYESRISGLIDELVGCHVHSSVEDLTDVSGWLAQGKDVAAIRALILANRKVPAEM
ncbi:MAG: hypothetical protein Q8P88_01290 [Candidatus Jorgensenbacteria bacterium]|nr:hypothetical protein [Candidatus Jorgensenbacteria bacterium]